MHSQSIAIADADNHVTEDGLTALRGDLHRHDLLVHQTELGGIDGRLWLYLGKSAVAKNDRICWQDKEFRVRSSRPYYIGEKLMYWWAALEQAKEAAQ